MTLTPDDRDALFKAFGRAFFRQDLDALYDAVVDAAGKASKLSRR